MTILAKRGLLLAANEAVFNVAELLDPALDAFEVINPDFTPDITSQLREVVAPDLSPYNALVTRKVGKITFSLEVKSNGNLNSTVAPRIGALLKACGMSVTNIDTANEQVFRTTPGVNNTGDLHFYGGTIRNQRNIYLKIKCVIVTGGASGAAVASFEASEEATYATGGHAGIDFTGSNEVILTNGSDIILLDVDGNEVVRIKANFQSNNPATGDVYFIHVRPEGFLYRPRSANFLSATLELYLPDNNGNAIVHQVTGARGTVKVNAQVGQFPTFDFEFTGSYVDSYDAATPEGTFETTVPAQVQYASLAIALATGRKYTGLCASQWSIDLAIDVQVRDCINAASSVDGTTITARAPTVSYDPEALLNNALPIWSYLEDGKAVEFWVRHGTEEGNVVCFHSPNHQITNITYGDRNNVRTYNIDGSLARLNGDDELEILFT